MTFFISVIIYNEATLILFVLSVKKGKSKGRELTGKDSGLWEGRDREGSWLKTGNEI